MLGQITSRQLTEWAAYEKVSGPLDRRYDQEALANIQEQLQYANYLLGAAHFTDKDNPDNPVPEPVRFARPEDAFAPEVEEDPQVALLEQEMANYQAALEVMEPGEPEREKLVVSIREVTARLAELRGEQKEE
jgi:hypothetical protein